MSTKNVFRKGSAAIPASSGGKFLKVTTDKAPIIVPQVDIDNLISVEQHEVWDIKPALLFPCLGATCPACKRDMRTKYKAFLPVLVKGEEGWESKIYAFGISVVRQLETLAEELGNIKGKAIKVIRKGKGFNTTYQLLPLGKEVDIDAEEDALDPTEQVEVLDEETIAEKLTAIFGEYEPEKEEETAKATASDDDWGE